MNQNIISNPILDRLPAHLNQYIKPQHYDQYSSIDQAVWRYVMRRNVDWLKQVAHESYISGLEKTGISIEHIPSMYGMNRILQEIGWAAVAVDGFIPPAAFMEFQAYNVLVIASEIRQLQHIKYTPAPDIIHEAAGHAPIIANPEYAEYLRRFGEIGSKAISSAHDWEMYESVRLLSQLKEQKEADPKAIKEAEQRVDELQNKKVELSEMAAIRNLHWWTVEYGLIGTPDDFKIYGAGLLSSIGESKWCMEPQVKKRLYTIAAADQDFDITRPQPHLFVTPNFAHLSLVLEEFANTMALRTGGLKGVQKLIDSKNLGTIELSTGLQITGVFTRVIPNERGSVAFVQTEGPTALCFHEKVLIGHETAHHPAGFGSPIGRLKGINLPIEDMSPKDLEAYKIYEAQSITLEFEGGIKLTGDVVTGTRNVRGKILVITFKNCLVTYNEEVLFSPDQGIYHLAVGKEVVSAFAGPADHTAFDLVDHELSPTLKVKTRSKVQQTLEELFQQIRDLRAQKKISNTDLDGVIARVLKHPSTNWLLLLEAYELVIAESAPKWEHEIYQNLNKLKTIDKDLKTLIDAGLELFSGAAI